MRAILLLSIALAGCTTGPTQFAKPDANAPEWQLNQGEWPDTNDFIPSPLSGPKDLLNAGR